MLIYCLIMDQKGYITSTKTYENTGHVMLKDAIVVPSHLYDEVFNGIEEGKQYMFVDGDIVIRQTKNVVDTGSALRQLRHTFDTALSNFAFYGMAIEIKLNLLEREQAFISRMLKTPYLTPDGVMIYGEQLESYFKEFSAFYQRLVHLLLKYNKLVEKAINQTDVEKHVSNFLKEVSESYADQRH